MKKSIYDKLDGNISQCLNYIIKKLKKGQMSVLVGAGFSKNSNEYYPDWAQLLFSAYRQIKTTSRQDLSEEDKNDIRKNPSKIAQEYIDFKGRREDLDIYIEKCLDRIEKSKSTKLDLHEKLLCLNWNDVITTNWDRLLETANERQQQYELVTVAKKLKIRNRKRIIKINGSLRTTEEQKKRRYSLCFAIS